MPVILSEAKDPGSFLWSSDLRTTAEILRGVYPERTTEILRFAQNDKRRTQDDTFRISSHLQRPGSTPRLQTRSPVGAKQTSGARSQIYSWDKDCGMGTTLFRPFRADPI